VLVMSVTSTSVASIPSTLPVRGLLSSERQLPAALVQERAQGPPQADPMSGSLNQTRAESQQTSIQ
jgi:hypothetical protein